MFDSDVKIFNFWNIKIADKRLQTLFVFRSDRGLGSLCNFLAFCSKSRNLHFKEVQNNLWNVYWLLINYIAVVDAFANDRIRLIYCPLQFVSLLFFHFLFEEQNNKKEKEERQVLGSHHSVWLVWEKRCCKI